MRKLLLVLVVLVSGCASNAPGPMGRCADPGGCFESKQQLMEEAIHNRPFAL